MSNRVLIKQITINNFRSIRHSELVVSNNNIFVGLNDAGKSNLLKALNLFFNGQTDYGQYFDFGQDFTYFHPKKSKKKKEVKIQIIFNREDTDIIWEKKWDINGVMSERLTTTQGDLPSRSKIPSILRSIRYRYIPAVKSRDYYKGLLSELYQAVSSALTSPLKSSIEEFSKVLSTYTDKIGKETADRLGLNSTLTMPNDLSELFKTLIFETRDKKASFVVNLDKRGDGIQARHIPYILNYISEEDKKSKGRRATNVYTIWGFEEPENGLEMTRAFEMAEDFMKYSEHIQMFISTHSPAFYLNGNNDDSKIFYASRNDKGETHYSESVGSSDLDDRLGILPIIAPYIEEKQAELEETKARLEKYKVLVKDTLSGDIDTILVEGRYDKLYLEKAIEIYSLSLQSKLKNNTLRIYSKPGEGGCDRIVDLVKSMYYYGHKKKTYAIFDRDVAGDNAKGNLKHFTQENKIDNRIFSKEWEWTEDMKLSCGSKIIPIVEVEHFLSSDFWKLLESKGYVEEKSYSELQELFRHFLSKDKSLNDIMREENTKIGCDSFFNEFNPRDDKKQQIYNLAISEFNSNENSRVFEGLEPTVRKLEEFFK